MLFLISLYVFFPRYLRIIFLVSCSLTLFLRAPVLTAGLTYQHARCWKRKHHLPATAKHAGACCYSTAIILLRMTSAAEKQRLVTSSNSTRARMQMNLRRDHGSIAQGLRGLRGRASKRSYRCTISFCAYKQCSVTTFVANVADLWADRLIKLLLLFKKKEINKTTVLISRS